MDSGDISSFVTNGEWDLIGENWALYRNMNNSTDKMKITILSLIKALSQSVKNYSSLASRHPYFLPWHTPASIKGYRGVNHMIILINLLWWLMKMEGTDNDQTEMQILQRYTLYVFYWKLEICWAGNLPTWAYKLV